MKTAAVQSIRQIKLESFNEDCLDLFKDLSVDSLIGRILYIAATWTNSCYCICGLTSSRRGHFSTYQLYGFTPSEIKLLNAERQDAVVEILCFLKCAVPKSLVYKKPAACNCTVQLICCLVSDSVILTSGKDERRTLNL